MAGSGCDHIGLFTRDADRLLGFYRRVFGLEVLKDEVLPAELVREIFGVADRCRFVKMRPRAGEAPRALLEIFQPLRRRLRRRRREAVGINHLGLSVGDREAFVAGLRGRRAPLIEVVRNGHSIFFLRDPDGNLAEIRE